MTETVHIRWAWEWRPGTPNSLIINANLHDAHGNVWGPVGSLQMDVSQLPDGVTSSLSALVKWSKKQMELRHTSQTITLPGGMTVVGHIEVVLIVYYSYSDWFRADGIAKYSAQVEKGLPVFDLPLDELPHDLREIVTALDAAVHDFVLDKALRMFQGAPAVSRIPSQLRWVFVAHHKRDEEFARRLATRLEQTGVFHAFFLPWEIGWADSIRAVEDAGLARCNAGIIVFTPEFLGPTGWRNYEYGGLINKRINGGAKVGYALLRGDHSDVPCALQDYFYADFRNLDCFEQEFLKIYRGLLGRPIEDRP